MRGAKFIKTSVAPGLLYFDDDRFIFESIGVK